MTKVLKATFLLLALVLLATIPAVASAKTENSSGALRTTVGQVAPSVYMSAANAQVRLNSPVLVTVKFSEPVSGFTVDDIMVGNGTASSFSGSDGDDVYTFDVTPNALVGVTVDIPADIATDGEGNDNTAAPQLSLGIPYDFDGSGGIGRTGIIAAIRDYFGGNITRGQAIAVIRLYFSTPAEPGSGTPEGDRAALVALHNATGGPSWERNNNWLSEVPISEWSGVTTGDNGRVTELDLGLNQLTGPIPASLSSLTNLAQLELGDNQLTGPVPAELGDLSNLQDLSLWGNQLTGPIPAELSNLSNLQELYLSENQLTGPIPQALGNLSNLQWLHLWGNQLTGPIPPELARLTNLEVLDLSQNQLTGEIPAELGHLTNLTVLYLSGNQLTGCVPGSLRDVADNDFAELELPFCASQDPLITLYDANGDGAIDISELFWAIDHYFAGRIDISQLFGVIDLYFSGPAPP